MKTNKEYDDADDEPKTAQGSPSSNCPCNATQTASHDIALFRVHFEGRTPEEPAVGAICTGAGLPEEVVEPGTLGTRGETCGDEKHQSFDSAEVGRSNRSPWVRKATQSTQ